MRSYIKTHLLVGCIALLGAADCSAAESLGAAFTYQGRLEFDGEPYTGSADLQFSLFDALMDGNQIGSSRSVAGVTVTGGLFEVTLDFGAEAFAPVDGVVEERYLEIEVAGPGSDPIVMSPRQPVSPTPYAIVALNSPRLIFPSDLPYQSTFSADGQQNTVAELPIKVSGPAVIHVTVAGSWVQAYRVTVCYGDPPCDSFVELGGKLRLRFGIVDPNTISDYDVPGPEGEVDESFFSHSAIYHLEEAGTYEFRATATNYIPAPGDGATREFISGHVNFNAISVMVFPE